MSRLRRQRRRRRNGPAQALLLVFGVFGGLCLLAAAAVVGWVVSVANSGPTIDDLTPKDPGAASEVLAADGTRLGFITSDILRVPIRHNQIPQVIRDATVAIEDRRFFEHKGVDFEGVVRAAIRNIQSKKDVEGGSTLTMQLVRNLYTQNTTRKGIEGYKRKIREAKLAEELEDKHPGERGKRWILNQYLNNVPYGTVGGQTAIGVQAAARVFFGKRAKDLELHEAALLAGLPQAPSAYNPFFHPERALARRNTVLRAMAKEGYISSAQAAAAMRRGLGVKRSTSNYYSRRRESFFFDYVRQQLIDEYGVDRVRAGGMKIYTTLNLKMQRAARQALEDHLGGTDRSGAIVSIDPRNGEIKAMASNADYSDFKFNLASQGGYAAGSTFKTMVLMAALRKGVDPNRTTYTSMPLKFNDPKWGPIDVKTYSGSYGGRMNLVQATLTSDNTVYQQLDLDIGPEEVAKTARDMGIKSKVDVLPAAGLGGLTHGVSPLEMANAYATIASGGWRNRVTAVRRVCFPRGPKYDCIDYKPRRHRAFDDGVTYEATKILKLNVERGTGTLARFGCPAAGKTGTVDDFTDAWFVGYTPRLSTAVWVGHATERRSLGYGAAGGQVAAPIWGQYMRTAHGDFCGDFPQPKRPFKAQPFFGKYATTGVPGNKAGDYDSSGAGDAQSFETGGAQSPGDQQQQSQGGGGTGNSNYPSDQYASPPQPPPNVGGRTGGGTGGGTTGGTGGGAGGGAGAPSP